MAKLADSRGRPASRCGCPAGLQAALWLLPILLGAAPGQTPRKPKANSLSSTLTAGILAASVIQSQASAPARPLPPAEDLPHRGFINCNIPHKAEVGQSFLVDVSLDDEDGRSSQAQTPPLRPTSITMDDNDRISCSPKQFKLVHGQHQLVKTRIQSTSSGLASIFAFADDTHEMCDSTVDAGFIGHLEAAPLTLEYHERKPLSIQITDSSGKPLRNGSGFLLRLQSADALISDPSESPQDSKKQDNATRKSTPGKLNTQENQHLVLRDLDAGKIYSDPVSIETDQLKGGSVHVLATLSLGENVVAQNLITIDVAPPEWLTCLIAITGALLYSLYNVALGKARVNSLGLAIFAGVIAWLFANFDLLGLKLDPHNLRTYAILGFLFSFVGIDILLARRFRPKDPSPRVPQPAPVQPSRTTPGERTRLDHVP